MTNDPLEGLIRNLVKLKEELTITYTRAGVEASRVKTRTRPENRLKHNIYSLNFDGVDDSYSRHRTESTYLSRSAQALQQNGRTQLQA